MDSLESLHKKLGNAGELSAVVKTMKAMAASNIGQYEIAVDVLNSYYKNIELAFAAYFREQKGTLIEELHPSLENPTSIVIIFGTDMGLVGQFNDALINFTSRSVKSITGTVEIWAVGRQIQLLLEDSGFNVTKSFSMPNSIDGIASLAERLLIDIGYGNKQEIPGNVCLYHNTPKQAAGYEAVTQQLLPLDAQWMHSFQSVKWPTKQIPQFIGTKYRVLPALIREYLFISLYRACAESLASENASRLDAMQRAQKNIDDILENLNSDYHKLRQSMIDEELFDVIAGFEALKNNKE